MNSKKGRTPFKIVVTLIFITFFGVFMATDLTAQVVEEWVVRYVGPAVNQNDIATDIAVDSSGNVYVFGRSMGTSLDYATVAYDSAGNQLWVARYDGPVGGNEYTSDIAVDSSGNVYVTGSSPGTSNTYPWQIDYTTVAYDSSGNELWVARYNGTLNEDDEPSAICTDSSGNVYVTGWSRDIGPTMCYTTIAYDSLGTELWVMKYNGTANRGDWSYDIAADTTGNVYVTGRSGTEIQGSDYATIKYSQFPTGPVEVDIDIKPGENPNSINLGSQGNVPVAIFSTADFDATTIDPTTVTLAGASVKLKGKGTPMASFEDINGDGLQDIIVHVDTTALELTRGDTEAILEGETFDGQLIRGVDTVRIVNE